MNNSFVPANKETSEFYVTGLPWGMIPDDQHTAEYSGYVIYANDAGKVPPRLDIELFVA